METSKEETKRNLDKLSEMKGKAYFYDNEEVTILNYIGSAGEDADTTEIYLSNGHTLYPKDWRLEEILNKFVPVSKQAIVLVNKKINEVSSVSPDVIGEMRNTILEQIRKLKENPSPEIIMQSKQIFQGVNTLTSLAKTEMNYHAMLDKQVRS